MSLPRAANAAPARLTAAEVRAAEGNQAFGEGVALVEKGDKEAASQRYRAAAEAYAAALAALKRGAADDSLRRTRYAARIARAYAAAREAFVSPALRQSASEWCARWAAEPGASDEAFAALRIECTHWPMPEPPPPPAPAPPEPESSAPEPSQSEPKPTGETIIVAGPVDDEETTGAAGPVDPPKPTVPRRATHPGRGLAIGGGVALGLGVSSLVVALAGAVRQGELQRGYLRDQCETVNPPHCGEIYERAMMFRRLSTAMVAVGSVLTLVGATLVAVAVRKRRNDNVALAPSLRPDLLGLAVSGRF
ncbi:hypothetical protein POL58_10190 [Nannocystis sp. ncelm1]|uniref:Uncharacterized protein n=1 Tax=Nannocystis radixulma TaxID=2995305 RepID=A0ABT5B1X3_9BACT|nr:hypothetical protein [Nannocystis radixulma]